MHAGSAAPFERKRAQASASTAAAMQLFSIGTQGPAVGAPPSERRSLPGHRRPQWPGGPRPVLGKQDPMRRAPRTLPQKEATSKPRPAAPFSQSGGAPLHPWSLASRLGSLPPLAPTFCQPPHAPRPQPPTPALAPLLQPLSAACCRRSPAPQRPPLLATTQPSVVKSINKLGPEGNRAAFIPTLLINMAGLPPATRAPSITRASPAHTRVQGPQTCAARS
jgi:hypothetical protein